MAILSNPSRPRTLRKRRPVAPLLPATAGILGILGGAVLYIRLFSVPWSITTQVSQEVKALQVQLQERRLENAHLRERLDDLSSPAGLEALARSRGFHRKNEQVYFYPQPSATHP